ncbi:MAG: response regulator transcription factor [Actinomycetota bacterium]|nr:response regulator transcription factor [Actinomycetota bacterium]
MIRVLIVDDNEVLRRGVVSLLEVADGIEVVGEAGTGKEGIAMAKEHKPDVVLLDVRMPVMDGIEAAGPLSKMAKVMMLTYSEDEDRVSGAIKAGASGYLVHGRFTPDELTQAVTDMAAGHNVISPAVISVVFDALREGPAMAEREGPARLTEREAEIMNLLAQGHSNGAIAAELFISEKTVKNHINRIYAKLGVANRAEAMASHLGVTR